MHEEASFYIIYFSIELKTGNSKRGSLLSAKGNWQVLTQQTTRLVPSLTAFNCYELLVTVLSLDNAVAIIFIMTRVTQTLLNSYQCLSKSCNWLGETH